MTEKMTKGRFSKDFKAGFSYPWGRASRLWNILWVLLPIFGWFALAGYGKKIARSLISGNTKELPVFGGFWNNFKEGVFIFVFMVPTMIVLFALNLVPLFGQLAYFLAAFGLLPWLIMNFFMKETFESLWDIKKAYRIVSTNVVEYLFAMLKTILYTIVYGMMCIVLVGIPCLAFGQNFFLAEFYRKN
ncbi:DUF4013 domain-containing protein [Candidatus Woesearchaeota archaeon]|nr:DUF4013 domain-containing protein [Candidatus Woesearchaeota archaeon]